MPTYPRLRVAASWTVCSVPVRTRDGAERLDQVYRRLLADSTCLNTLRRWALTAERARVATLRREERIGDDAFHRVEEELDWAEAEMDGSGR